MRKQETLEITLGDLIAALVDETAKLVPDEKAAHALVAYILGDLLNNSKKWHLARQWPHVAA
jgi:hypothetical protein